MVRRIALKAKKWLIGDVGGGRSKNGTMQKTTPKMRRGPGKIKGNACVRASHQEDDEGAWGGGLDRARLVHRPKQAEGRQIGTEGSKIWMKKKNTENIEKKKEWYRGRSLEEEKKIKGEKDQKKGGGCELERQGQQVRGPQKAMEG